MFALVDCNNFYASCERVFRPDLIGKPIVVLSNNDGCVIARSNEAKEVGVPMGAAAFEYEAFFRQNQVNVFSANFALYGNMSNRVMYLLEEYFPEIELYSIDEAFLKVKGYDYFNVEERFRELKEIVTKGTGIPISIGAAETKALSKVANRIAKKYPKQTKGVYLIDTEEKRIKALKWTKIGDVWGIGRRYAKRLKLMGVENAYDFTQLGDAWIQKNMSIIGLRLKKDLMGIPTLDLDDITSKRNIATTRSFERNLTEKSDLKDRVSTFAISCAEKLRQQKACCKMLLLFIQTNRYRKDLDQYSKSTLVKLPYPTNSGMELVSFVNRALDSIFVPGYAYKRAGVVIMDFIPETAVQLSVFENSNPKHVSLMKTIDAVNEQFGQQKVRLAVQDQKRIWKMKQERLSPCYTTNINDIITINV